MIHLPCDCERCTGRPAEPARRYEVAPGCYVVSPAGTGRTPPGVIADTVRAICESAAREARRPKRQRHTNRAEGLNPARG